MHMIEIFLSLLYVFESCVFSHSLYIAVIGREFHFMMVMMMMMMMMMMILWLNFWRILVKYTI